MSKDTISPFGLRMPQELRELLDTAADANKRSLNVEIVSRLKKSFDSEPLIRPEEFFDLIAVDGPFRLRTTSTFRDMQRLCFLIRKLQPRRILLGARREHLNGYVMVSVVDAGPLLIVADKTLLNITRPVREAEIQHFFKVVGGLRRWEGIDFIPSHLPETANLPADHALAVLRTLPTKPLTPENLIEYLSLLTDHPQHIVIDDYLSNHEIEGW